jgi:UDP-glucose 4-epimerase
MNVLVTGNLGYVGSELTGYLKNKEKKINIYGLDIGYFKKNKTSKKKNKIKKQYICDIRNLSSKYLKKH